jgi:hypothetical protein
MRLIENPGFQQLVPVQMVSIINQQSAIPARGIPFYLSAILISA